MAITNPQEYEDFFYEADTKGTPSLERFQEAWDYDDNVVWRLDKGHLINLLEAAMEYVWMYKELDR